MATDQVDFNNDDVSKQQETNVSESPGLKIEQKVVEDSEDKPFHHSQNEGGSVDPKGGEHEVTSDTGGVKISSSVEGDDSHPSVAEKIKGKFEHAVGGIRGQEDGLEEDPNPELAYETAAVSQPKPSVKAADDSEHEVKTSSSPDEEDESKPSHPSVAEKIKDKFDHAAGSVKGQEDGLEEDPSPELAYDTAAVTQPKPSLISKVKQAFGKSDKTPAAAGDAPPNTTPRGDDAALSKDLGEKLDLKPSSESSAAEGAAGEHQNQHPSLIQKIAHKIGISSPKS